MNHSSSAQPQPRIPSVYVRAPRSGIVSVSPRANTVFLTYRQKIDSWSPGTLFPLPRSTSRVSRGKTASWHSDKSRLGPSNVVSVFSPQMTPSSSSSRSSTVFSKPDCTLRPGTMAADWAPCRSRRDQPAVALGSLSKRECKLTQSTSTCKPRYVLLWFFFYPHDYSYLITTRRNGRRKSKNLNRPPSMST